MTASCHGLQAACSNERHALQDHTSHNACDPPTHTEFAHNQARSAVSHSASSADHVLLPTINLTLCGHTLYEDMFVAEAPRLTQEGPACMFFVQFKTQMYFASSSNTKSCVPALQITLFAIRTRHFQTAWPEAHAELSFPQTAQALQHQETVPKQIVLVLCQPCLNSGEFPKRPFQQLNFNAT